MINWKEEIVLPTKEEDVVYAYILETNREPIKCDKDTLFEIIAHDNQVRFITTPNHNTYIIPGTDYETLQPILKRKKSNLINNFFWILGFAILFGGFVLFGNQYTEDAFWSDDIGILYLLMIGVMPFLTSMYELYAIKSVNDQNYQKECEQVKFDFWLDQKTVFSIYGFILILVVLNICIEIKGVADSLISIGLIKSKVLSGAYWRILTSIFVNKSIVHTFFSIAAIHVIGKMIIRITGFSYFVTVFLVSGILGSVFSLYFVPIETSIGTCRGVMGLIGFLFLVSLNFGTIPRDIRKAVLIALALVATAAVATSDSINYPSHIGGLVGGMLIGLVSIQSQKNRIPYQSTTLMNIVGVLATLILVAGFSIIFIRM